MKSRNMKCAGHGVHTVREICVQNRDFRPSGVRPLGRRRSRWKDNTVELTDDFVYDGTQHFLFHNKRDLHDQVNNF